MPRTTAGRVAIPPDPPPPVPLPDPPLPVPVPMPPAPVPGPTTLDAPWVRSLPVLGVWVTGIGCGTGSWIGGLGATTGVAWLSIFLGEAAPSSSLGCILLSELGFARPPFSGGGGGSVTSKISTTSSGNLSPDRRRQIDQRERQARRGSAPRSTSVAARSRRRKLRLIHGLTNVIASLRFRYALRAPADEAAAARRARSPIAARSVSPAGTIQLPADAQHGSMRKPLRRRFFPDPAGRAEADLAERARQAPSAPQFRPLPRPGRI